MPASVPTLGGKVGELLRAEIDDPRSGALEEVKRLIHEFEDRQSELQQQNEELRKRQRQLEAYRDRYVDLYDFAPLGYVTLDEEGYVQEINLAGARLLGAERGTVIGYGFADYVAKKDQRTFLDHVRQCARGRREVTSELRLVSKAGLRITAQFHSIPIEGPADEAFLKTAITDITDRRRAEEALEQERNLLRTLIDNVPDYVYIKDAHGRFLAANAATARIMGAASPNDLLGKTDADFYPPELAAEYRADEEELVRSGQPLVDKDEPHVCQGHPRTVLTTKVPLKDRHGSVVGLVGISRDITERKRAEEALRDSEYELRLIMDSVPTLIAFVDSECRYRRINETYERCFSLGGEDVRGRHIWEVLGEAAWQAIRPHVERALAGEIVTAAEELPPGTLPRRLHATYTPERDASGRVRGLVVHAADCPHP